MIAFIVYHGTCFDRGMLFSERIILLREMEESAVKIRMLENVVRSNIWRSIISLPRLQIFGMR
jgi:hypothetical protein